MSLLNYSHTLVAGTPENINDVQDMFTDVRTVLNGNVDATNLATSAKPATLLGAYQTLLRASGTYSSLYTVGTVLVLPIGGGPMPSVNLNASFVTNGGNTYPGTPATIYLDPAAHAVSGLTPKLRLTGSVMNNGTSPSATFEVTLNPVTVGGSAGNVALNRGTAVTGSTTSPITPVINTTVSQSGSDFSIPTAGVYMPFVTASGTSAANAAGVLAIELALHYV